MSSSFIPGVMTIAGSDCSGGAGIEADLKTITAHGCYGMTCIDSITVQNTTGVKSKLNTPEHFLEQILVANFEDLKIDAIKIGMLTEEVSRILPALLERYHSGKFLVIDTLLSSTSGFNLTSLDTLKRSMGALYRLATIITPNYVEACKLYRAIEPSSDDLPPTLDAMKKMARRLQEEIGCSATLIKGGHIPWNEAGIQAKSEADNRLLTDVLYESNPQRFTVFYNSYIDNTQSTHGTGCTLASSIASNLALKHSLRDSVQLAIHYTHNGIKYADRSIGHGKGPLNHCFAL